MPLSVLEGAAAASNDSLIRQFHRAQLDWSRHLGDEIGLPTGVGVINRELAAVRQANRVFDSQLVDERTPDALIEEVEAVYQDAGSTCGGWVLNPSAEDVEVVPLATALQRRNYFVVESQIMVLPRVVPFEAVAPEGLTIIPARASFKHYRQLAETSARDWQLPQLADAAMLHLDDPRYDALLVLDGTDAVGTIGVLSAGEAGVIEDVYVVNSHRGRGLGRILLHRALEICMRSSFKYVLLDVDPTYEPAAKLYRSVGFVPIGKFQRFISRG